MQEYFCITSTWLRLEIFHHQNQFMTKLTVLIVLPTILILVLTVCLVDVVLLELKKFNNTCTSITCPNNKIRNVSQRESNRSIVNIDNVSGIAIELAEYFDSRTEKFLSKRKNRGIV